MKERPKRGPLFGGSPGWMTFLVILLLISESESQFTTSGQISISEGAIVGTKKLLEPSILPGRSLQGQFSIVSGNEGSYFQLQATPSQDGRGGIAYLHLETRKRLDRELNPQFKLNISSNPGQGFLDLTVLVLDINDNPPIFEQTEYVININESTRIGSGVVQVAAKDADEGKNAEISYFMANPEEVDDHFVVDAKSGLIKVSKSLKCSDDDLTENGEKDCLPCLRDVKLCSLIVVATDGGQPRQSAQTVVKIGLLDTNDHDPTITFNVFPKTNKQEVPFASVNENAKVGTNVAIISVNDEDRGVHGQTSLEIIEGNSQGHFQLQKIQNSIYILRVAARARLQRGRDFQLLFQARDQGIPARSSTARLEVRVKEINEFKPKFSKAKYNVEISEAALPGSSVINIQAIDEDQNADLTYDLIANPSGFFKISKKSGLITVQNQLDRETQDKVQLKVKVSDGKHEAFTDVEVKILDVNDEAPVFDLKKYEFQIEENSRSRQFPFGKVRAIDRDFGENGRVSYTIQEPLNDIFEINELSGELSSKITLDREAQSEYLVTVVASDHGQDQVLSAQVPVHVIVTDVNDNPPILYPIHYFMDLDSGNVELKAEDADENSEVTFELQSPANTNEFYLEGSQLSIKNPNLFSSDKSVRELLILAKDSGGKESPKLAKVSMYPDQNELKNNVFNPNSRKEYFVVEDNQLREPILGRQVGQLSLERTDVTLEITNGDPESRFDITNNGMIKTKKIIDREVQDKYSLTIFAYNNAGFDSFQLDVLVEDLNDNVPTFNKDDPTQLFVDLNAPIGHQIHAVKVKDQDLGNNGKLKFYLEENSNSRTNNQFDIGEETGIIELKSKLSEYGTSFDITVKVKDSGDESLTNFKTYTIKVLSEFNDGTPIFDSDLYEVSLSEATPLNTEIVSMIAIDDDIVTYNLIDQDEKFDIFPDGQVYLKDKLDRESQAYHSVIVIASDQAHHSNIVRSSTATLVVYVTDENDNPPVLEKTQYHFTLPENSPFGQVIGRVSATDVDLGRNAELTYKFTTKNELFAIDEQTGFISSIKVIDRETLSQTTFDLKVIVSDLGLVSQNAIANVKINVTDENDNAPRFAKQLYEAFVSEDANIGSEIITVFAKDLDEGLNGKVTYSFSRENEMFSIDKNSGVITLKSQLDREIEDHYEILVHCQDHGLPTPMTSWTTLKVHVKDVNDNEPKFTKTKINLKIPEDSNIGDEVYRFEATDEDLGLNGKVNYLLLGNNLNGFILNSLTGIMTIGSPLDRETRDHFDLVVNAVDNGISPKTGSVTVSIDITDVNDNMPIIQTSSPVIMVKEGIPINSKFAKIDASDSDLGANGKVEFALKENQDTFEIDKDSGQLFTKTEIDREVQDKYELTVVVTDGGSPKSLSTEKTFVINVEDVNDNKPIITSLNTAMVYARSPSGTPITTIHATDKDTGSNGAITYRFQSPSQMFQINSNTGEIKLTKDYGPESPQSISLTVIASDGALPSTRKSSSISLSIIGSRTLPGLSFETESYNAVVVENSPVGTPIVTVSLNGDPLEKVEYHIIGCESQDAGKDRGLFNIDKFTGQVTTATQIDREIEGSSIIIHVVALIGDTKMSTTKINVECQDENDSKPEFDPNFNLELSEAFLPGRQLGYVRANDADLNAIITYSLGLASQNYLNIDAQSGAITLTSSIDREILDHLEVIIVASDGVHTTEWKKMVPVQDINDNAPIFPTPQFSFDILENAPRGAFVGKIEASDTDENDKITYNFISDWGLDTFSIDPTSGIITLSGSSLDHESIEHYILTVSASDSGSPVLTATSTVYINVKDINDNPPEIEQNVYDVSVFEDAPIGSNIVQVLAHDADSEMNLNLQFSLDSSVSNTFAITDNGTIVTKSRLDREFLDFYSFEVTVADTPDTHNQQVSKCIVKITVKDVNDQVPVFENIGRFSIIENSPPNTPVTPNTIRAIDKDAGANAEIEYLLEDSLGGKFSIGRIDGVLRSVKTLDREEQSAYSLSITAIDNGTPRLSSRVEITIDVVDINDNPPRFEQKQYSASVLENASIGMDILQTSAYDLDVGNNGKLRFTIISGDPNGHFEIGESTGIIRVAKRLGYEIQNSYALMVQVEDSGLEPRSATAEVNILIIDTNDNVPEFQNSPYFVHVVEERELLEPIMTLKALDRDGTSSFSDLEYSIRAGGTYDDLFQVNRSTGQVFVKSVLDREKTEKMTLEVVAIDSGSPRLTGTGTVYVIVDDINDHEPTFENDHYDFKIVENSPKGSEVAQVQALDKDADMNGKVTYELTGTEHFIVNASSGMILVNGDLDREEDDVHQFEVVAHDNSNINPKSSTVMVFVKIQDENDNRPIFDVNSTDYWIPPGLKPGDFVLGIFASDQDEGFNAKLSFGITGKDSAMFNINRANGVVTASNSFRDKTSYDITVTVSDSSLSAKNRLSIYLAKEHEVPTFDESSTPPEVNLDEDVRLGSNVVTFKANPSSGGNGDAENVVKYAIAGGNLDRVFDVDPMTGIVYVNQSLDFETNERYELWVKAFYESRPLYTAAKKISVVISDKNDNPPQFEQTLVKVSKPEELYPPFEIAKVYAFDPDTGNNGKIKYELLDDNNGMFTVDEKSGLIRCTQKLDREKLDRYTLKLVAVDQGLPRQLSSTATILFTLEDVNDNPPRFTRLNSLNVTENTAIGTNLLQLETVDLDSPENAQVKYKLIQNPDQAFAVHETLGNLSIAKNLDREIRDEYSLKVQASNIASGVTWEIPTVITITVQDANDNKPKFDQDIYEFTLKKDKYVGRVHALDRDAVGPNSELIYELSHDNDFFTIDEYSGEIHALDYLKSRTSKDVYQLRVIVKDGGNPPMSSECQVRIHLQAVDNQPPKFADNLPSEIGVPSNIQISTTILQLNATDEDESQSSLRYDLKPGNYFMIQDSQLKVAKSLRILEGSSFDLKLTVMDSSNETAERSLQLSITDDNLYSPEFQAPTTQLKIREDEPVDNVILTVQANDQDEGINGMIEYSIIKGDPMHMFKIDKTSGSISVAKNLDYEDIPVYNIMIKAKDRGFYSRSATSSVKIFLADVNDNPPSFDQEFYRAKLKENAPPGVIITQMIAHDLDSAKNGDIVYEFSDEDENRFEIDAITGVVKALVSFDYELVSNVNLKIRAKNPKDKDQRPAETLLKIEIVGENEFYPKFKQPVFQFTVSESAQDDTYVGQVEAIDNDGGIDGEIFYYFVGASNEAGFFVDKKTGVIKVGNKLDRESQNRYVLTILAKNLGSIHGNDTDEAQVIIQVQDGNDPPVFKKSRYQAKVSEDSPVGTKVVQTLAVDKDVRPRNSQFVYVIADGNINNAFSIGSNTGEIVVETDQLDRETIGIYNLTVQAVDNGAPPAIGETEVIIELLDVNDSPPILETKEAFIKENSPPGSFIAQLKASDQDLDPNAGPFQFFLNSNEAIFDLEQTTGILKTRVTLDRESVEKYDIDIEVQDNGFKKSKAILHVEVLDENDNPSRPRNVMVIIKNYEGTFPGGTILNVRPDDPDIKGNYQCQLINGSENMFIVNQDCSVQAGRIHNGREYALEIMINDGKHPDVRVQIKLEFHSFSEYAVDESVAIRFQDTQADKVLGFFANAEAEKKGLVELLSMNVLTDGTVECFVAYKENELFKPRKDTIEHLDKMSIERKFETPVVADYDPCSESPCLHNGKCSKKTVVLKRTEITESGETIFNSPVLLQNITCQCQPEYAGDRCQIQKNPCIPNPCQDGGQCFQEGDSFRCLCPPLRGGQTCEIQKTNVCHPNPCSNGGSCKNNARDDGFFCLCRPGYIGELCQSLIDSCRTNPCLNGGTCIPLNPNYKCRCHDHFYGNHCEHSTFGFEELSFATFPPLDANTNDISVIFATSKANSLLVYNFGKTARGRSDFLSVELVNGHPRLSWGGSGTSITKLFLTNKRVDTGRWYKVTATRNNRVASLSVEDCTESGEFCKACLPNDPTCFTKKVGEAGTLVFNNNPMFFGGIEDETVILDRPGQLNSVDFVGCIKSISINGNDKNLITESLNKTGLKDTCNYVESGSCSRGDECGPTGTCVPLWSYHKCQCGPENILALDCGYSFAPFTLTENQEVHYRPTRLFKHYTKLPNTRWKTETSNQDAIQSLSVTFRTLSSNGYLLQSHNKGFEAYTHLEIKEDGVLEYRSKGSLRSSNEVVLNTNINVADGSWHTITIEVHENVLQIFLDESKEGFDVEFSAVHNFMDPALDKVIIGGQGFRGCVTNFTLNNELQSLEGGIRQLLEANVPSGVHLNGCDLEILRVAQPQTAVDVGVTIVIIFFVVVLCTILVSFTYFKMRKQKAKAKGELAGASGQVNQSLDLHDEQQLNNSRIPLHSSSGHPSHPQPDIIETERGDRSRFNNDNNFEAMEHYDIENASSIAPSDIDIVYHYKGYREGHHRSNQRSLPKKKKNPHLNNTPLARLSPSSEMSHNTPRILTLKDLSGKPLPMSSLLTEQSERSLNSPVSHVSSAGSRHRLRGGLTSENVARFNNAHRNSPMRSITPKNSTLVNTLDLVSMGSEKKAAKSPRSASTASDSSSEDINGDDDSFTCSEYECDSNKGQDQGQESNMVFSKLMDLGPSHPSRPSSRPSSSRQRFRTSDEDDEEDLIRPPRPDSRSWEHLLTWWPDYESFAGVFKDIAELPNIGIAIDNDICRPPPLGQHHDSRRNDEEYI